jgi:hypothetical protein
LPSEQESTCRRRQTSERPRPGTWRRSSGPPGAALLEREIDARLEDGDREGAARAANALGEMLLGEERLSVDEAYRWALGLGIPRGFAQEIATHLRRSRASPTPSMSSSSIRRSARATG